MAKKHWISIKRGLSEDPKHRERIGMAVWAFMHILDRADWETGVVFDWKDKAEAQDMSMNERTLRDWRQRLEELGYIKCEQKQHSLNIVIYNWINPKDYSGKVINPKGQLTAVQGDTQGDTTTAPSEFQGDTQDDTQGDTQGDSESVTPTSSSNIKSQRSKAPALDFKKMTVPEARALPTIKLYLDATEYFPGSVVWQHVHETITKHGLTYEKIHEAAVQWALRGYKPTNVQGILDWAINGIPASGKGSATPAPYAPGYKPFKPPPEVKAVRMPDTVREQVAKIRANTVREKEQS